MPFYSYKCTECGSELEVQQKINSDLLVYCPHCKDPTLEKQLTAPGGFSFKGVAFSATSKTH